MKESARFQLDTVLDEGKAVVREEGGDLYIEGIAADYGIDRQDEAFEPGAFTRAISRFMKNPVLAYHHDAGKSLGVVERLEERDDGLWMRARVDAPAPNSWAADIYRKIQRGSIKALSVGGIFRRRMGADGRPRIHDMDFTEISVTPVPVNPRTMFAVAGKAFETEEPGAKAIADWFEERLADLNAAADRLAGALEGDDDCGCAEGKAQRPTAEDRRKYGMADGAFPIWHCGKGPGGVGAAKSDLGRTKKPRATVIAHIKRRARALGCPEAAKFD